VSPKRRQRGEGSVYQRAEDGLWVARIDLGVVDGKRRRKQVTAKTQKEVVQKLRAARKAIDAGDTNTAGTTLTSWLTYWLEQVCPGKPRMKPKTLRTYRSYVERYIIPALGAKRLDKLTAADVRALHRHILTQTRQVKGKDVPLSPTTAHHAHRILGTALNDAMRDGKVTRNVVTLVPAPPKAAVPQDALTLNQFAALMRHLDGHRLQSRWAFGLFTGARQGECLGLTWQHLDLTNGIADLAWQLQRIPYRHGCADKPTAGEWPCGRKRGDRCTEKELDVQPGFEYRQLDGNLCLQRPKTKGSTRVIPLPGPLLIALKERRALYEQERRNYTTDHGLVWAREDGRPIDGRVDWAEWRDMLETLELVHMKLHVARHTAASLLMALGVPEDVRMAIMGHNESATQRRYAHLDMGTARAAMETYGAAVAELL
jgi:integrase